MNKQHHPAPWYNPELPGLHCFKCAATVNLGALESMGVPRGKQITYAQKIFAGNHLMSPLWSSGWGETEKFLSPKDRVRKDVPQSRIAGQVGAGSAFLQGGLSC